MGDATGRGVCVYRRALQADAVLRVVPICAARAVGEVGERPFPRL
jgi:hypothetical protein